MPPCNASACGCWDRLIVDALCMPSTERIRVSRMREIRTSGLKKGEEAVSLPLPYSTERRCTRPRSDRRSARTGAEDDQWHWRGAIVRGNDIPRHHHRAEGLARSSIAVIDEPIAVGRPVVDSIGLGDRPHGRARTIEVEPPGLVEHLDDRHAGTLPDREVCSNPPPWRHAGAGMMVEGRRKNRERGISGASARQSKDERGVDPGAGKGGWPGLPLQWPSVSDAPDRTARRSRSGPTPKMPEHPAAPRSLCRICVSCREVISGKGSRFLLCLRSRSDRMFPKYPMQPVVRCEGFERRGSADESSEP